MKRILSLVLIVVLMSLCFTQSTFASDKISPRSIPVGETTDGNDDLDSAQEIENDFTVTGTISSENDDSDYYKIVPTISGKMNVWLGNIPSDMDLDLYSDSTAYSDKGGWSTIWKIIFLEEIEEQ